MSTVWWAVCVKPGVYDRPEFVDGCVDLTLYLNDQSGRCLFPRALNQIWAATPINRTTRPLVTPATMNPMIAINHSSMGQT